jgi:hypothetical protein
MKNKATGEAYYAKPPQMPSRLMRRKTRMILGPFDSEGKNPTADSKVKVSSMADWRNAGSDSRRAGRGGSPIDIEDREKNTVVW